MSVPGRFKTWHPSCQYSSICASVSAEPRASLPCFAGLGDGAHDLLEARMIELQVDAQRGAQIGVPVRQHVDALDRGDRLHVLQAFERLDRGAEDDVRVGPGAVLGWYEAP